MRRGGGVALVAAALAAAAFVPSAHRVASAIAAANEKAGRGRALRLEVELRGPDGRLEASGVSWLNPGGAARLELRGSDGSVETHLGRGLAQQAERDGRALESPRPLLPPWRLLQAESAAELRGALLQIGADPDRIDLGLERDHDCYVLGGREPGLEGGRGAVRAAFWVDAETLEPVRIDRGDGVRYRFGPPRDGDAIRFPSFVEVEAPGALTWRLEIQRVELGKPPAAPPRR